MQALTTRLCFGACLVVAAVLAFAWPLAIDSLAQPATPGSSEWPTLTADGQPDIQGVWGNAEIGTWTVNYEPPSYLGPIGMPALGGFIQSNSGPIAPPSMQPRETPIVDPPDAILPYQPWALERRNSVMTGYLDPEPWQMDTQTPGWPTGIVRKQAYSGIDGGYGGPFQILQPPGYVVFLYETHHEFRIVPLDGRPQPGQDIKMWLGSSRGHWEDNTLVIDVANNNDSPRMTVIGDFHSDEMRATERWTFVDNNTIEYRVTIDDPKVFTRSWTLLFFIERAPEGTELLEYAGVEGSTSLFTLGK